MSTVKDYKLELTDFEQVALEMRDKDVKKSNSKEIAINMLKEGLNFELILKITTLTIEEVESLNKNLK